MVVDGDAIRDVVSNTEIKGRVLDVLNGQVQRRRCKLGAPIVWNEGKLLLTDAANSAGFVALRAALSSALGKGKSFSVLWVGVVFFDRD
jgi:hypothetical protein